MKVNFYNQTDLKTKAYEKIIKKALFREENNKTMEVIFVTPEEIRRINKEFRQIDKATDVLSFPNEDEIETSIGDIFINLDQAFKQASEYGHTIFREVAFLAVHGYLHLIGYDHETKEEETEMFRIQEEILNKAKIERK